MATYSGFKEVLENRNKIAKELVDYADNSETLEPKEVTSLVADKLLKYFEQTFGAKAKEKEAAAEFFERYSEKDQAFMKLAQALMVVPRDYIRGIGLVSEAMQPFYMVSDSYSSKIEEYPKKVESQIEEILKENNDKQRGAILEQIILADIYESKKKESPQKKKPKKKKSKTPPVGPEDQTKKSDEDPEVAEIDE